MRTLRWRRITKRFTIPVPILLKRIMFLILGAWLSLGLVRQLKLDDGDIVYVWSPWDESMDTKTYRPPPNPPIDYANVKDDTEYPEWNPTKMQNLLESPTSICRRLTNLGGAINCRNCHTCKMDGNKYVCFDNDVRPHPRDCLIYSFGVGGELTWDRAMREFNCDVYAFDMTTKWNNMALEDGFHFLNLGIYYENYDSKLNMSNGDERDPIYHAQDGFLRKLSTIREILGHTNRPIDILKMDIEFTEWDVFEKIFSTPQEAMVLDDVKQIALEIHLDDFKNKSASARVAGGRRFEKILQNLYDHGFHMAHTELNTAFQTHAEVRGQIVPLFRESLFIRRP